MEKEDQMDENIDELLSRLDIVLDFKRKKTYSGRNPFKHVSPV